MAHILVTGGAGFLGQYLIPHLHGAGHEVRVVDLHQPRAKLTDWETHCSAIHYDVDVTRPESLVPHFENLDVVFHLAGVVSFWRKHAQLLHRVNVQGTANVLQAAGKARVIAISSVAAVGYNNDPDHPIDETYEFQWQKCQHKHYMYSKHLAELAVIRHAVHGGNAVIVNPGLMWGPGDLTNSAKLIERMQQGKLPACPPGGTNIVDVRDVAAGLVNFIDQGKSGERFILGGDNITFREVYDVLAEVLGVDAPRRSIPRWLQPLLYYGTLAAELLSRKPPALTSDNVESSCMFRYFTSAKAERKAGWRRQFTFRQMIEDSVRWLQERQTPELD